MARSALFRTLRRLFHKAHVANVTGTPPAELAGPSRREVFAGALSAAALAPLVAACGDNRPGPGTRTDKVIAIVGGGIAGMSCLHFLAQAGVTAQVYEASMRIGGRTYSQRTGFADGQLCELGGELIDTDHIVMPALARHYGLTLDDLPALTEGLVDTIFHFDGGVVDEAALVTAFMPLAAKMATAVMAGDANPTEFDRIDNLSIPEWLTTDGGLAANAQLTRILKLAYIEEFGLEVEEQSAWNLITLIDYANPDPFHIFGDSDERFHIHQGNDAVALGIYEAYGDQVTLDRTLTKVAAAGERFELTFSSGDGDHTVVADHVIYALPFTKLREVDLAAAGLSAGKLDIIMNLGYGSNAKLMMQFTKKPWEDHGSAGGSITDVGQVQTTWATSRGQAGASGLLTNFVGGNRGVAIGDGTALSQAQMVLPWLETIWPGAQAAFNGTAVRQHWPSVPYVRASYATYRKGQWAYFGLEGKAEGNQHFCGEHTSEDFQGYMEGGAETGAMVAGEVLDTLGIAKDAVLSGLLSQLTGGSARVRASYHGGRTPARMKLAERRRFARDRHGRRA